MATFETEYQDTVVCPACGHKETNPTEIDFGYGMDSDAETVCASCGMPLFVQRTATVFYSTVPLKAAKQWLDMVADAARASEAFGDDECEAFAAELRRGRP